MKKVLILTAGYGAAHNVAARNLREALEVISDEARVEVLDLFESSYGAFNSVVKNACLGMAQLAPKFWGGIHSLIDNSTRIEKGLPGFAHLKNTLGDILHETQPDSVISTFPLYAHIIQELYRDHSERPFSFITVVTDAMSVNSSWYRAPSDFYCVSSDASASALREAGVPEEKIKLLGFPVSHLFTIPSMTSVDIPTYGEQRRILYIANQGKKKTTKMIERLLDIPDTQLTVLVGSDAELKAKLMECTREYGERVKIFGWTNQLPQLMLASHLVIGKADGASVQEAVAAGCPMIANQVIPGQEESNALFITEYGVGAVAERNREVPELVKEAFAHKARIWQEWRRNLTKISKPDASLRLAELVLSESETTDPTRQQIKLFAAHPDQERSILSTSHCPTGARMLLCDFHIHTNYSDGKLSAPDVVDFYGRLGFDCICITDHLADPRRLIGKLARLSNMTVNENQLDEYFDVLERERQRAWRKYGMIVLTGIEFNKDGYTSKSSAHLLGIGLKAPISSSLDLTETIAHIHAQDGLAVASHPHIMKSEWGKDTLYLWENHEQFAPLLDAWEIANRNNIFDCVGMKRLPFLANSDFHKPKHIYSWKTLLYCEKNEDAIKECVRRNEHVSITLYREGNQFVGEAETRKSGTTAASTLFLPPPLPERAAFGR